MRKAQRETIYASLEREMLSYSDYARVPVQPTDEPLVPIQDSDNLQARQIVDYMRPYTGDRVFVREGVLTRLTHAAALLDAIGSRMQLDVVYGYRALAVQKRRFEEVKAEVERDFGYKDEELLIAVHRRVAIPAVAGHPAGAAVDLQIMKNGSPLDFGTNIWEFNNRDSYSRSPFVSKKARSNRELLRGVMTEVGFAPFDGEWWHFSHGDKEAAKYYGEESAKYEQVDFQVSSEFP